jgi:hypothetical protein
MSDEPEVHRWDVLDRDGERFDGITAPTEERAKAVVRGVYPGKPFTLAPVRRK